MRGFLISWATCRAISPQASTRAARVRAVASSRATTQPSGAGPREASWARIWRAPTTNSRSTMRSLAPSRNARTASQTICHSAGAACGNRSPGASGTPRSSAARGFAIVTRSPSSTAMTPVATFARTCAVRRRASSSAVRLRVTSLAIRSNADITGANSRGAPGGNAGSGAPLPTAPAASRKAATGRASPRAATSARYTAATRPAPTRQTPAIAADRVDEGAREAGLRRAQAPQVVQGRLGRLRQAISESHKYDPAQRVPRRS